MNANPLRDATLAARKVDPHIGTRVKAGLFTIVSASPRAGRSHDVTVLAGPMSGAEAVGWLAAYGGTTNAAATASAGLRG